MTYLERQMCLKGLYKIREEFPRFLPKNFFAVRHPDLGEEGQGLLAAEDVGGHDVRSVWLEEVSKAMDILFILLNDNKYLT